MPIFIIFNCEFAHLKKQVSSSNTFRQQPKLEETHSKKNVSKSFLKNLFELNQYQKAY